MNRDVRSGREGRHGTADKRGLETRQASSPQHVLEQITSETTAPPGVRDGRERVGQGIQYVIVIYYVDLMY